MHHIIEPQLPSIPALIDNMWGYLVLFNKVTSM